MEQPVVPFGQQQRPVPMSQIDPPRQLAGQVQSQNGVPLPQWHGPQEAEGGNTHMPACSSRPHLPAGVYTSPVQDAGHWSVSETHTWFVEQSVAASQPVLGQSLSDRQPHEPSTHA